MIYICHQRPPFLVTIRLEQLYCNKKGAFFGITFDAHPHSGWFICLERFAFSTGLIALQNERRRAGAACTANENRKKTKRNLKTHLLRFPVLLGLLFDSANVSLFSCHFFTPKSSRFSAFSKLSSLSLHFSTHFSF